ncbi:MAG: glycosyltransferase [Clostridia bacterium]|nr:glycosyltransferase [Clostridia bacterium]
MDSVPLVTCNPKLVTRKLLHICCNYATTGVFVRLFSELAGAGLDQRVYVPEKRAAHMGRNLPQGSAYPVHYSLIVRPWDRPLYHTKARRAALDLANSFDLGAAGGEGMLIHAHTLFTDGGIAYRLHRRYGIPFVVSVRFTDLEYFYRYMPHLRGHALRILRAARRVVFLSPGYRQRMLERYIPAPLRDGLWAKSAVIPNGIAPEWFQGAAPRSRQPGRPLIVAFAGKLEKRKQPLLAADAVLALQKLLPDASVSLRVAGSGPLEGALRAHPAARSGAMTLLGTLEGTQAMRDFYDGCHLFLLPSRAETFGMAYLEAMSRGLPVLYTRGQGFDGQFAEGEAGFAVEPNDPAGIARAALAALDGYGERSARCIELAASLQWNKVAGRIAKMYRSVGEEVRA